MHRILYGLLFIMSFSVYAGDDVLLRLHGSNTIGSELAPALVRGWFQKRNYVDIVTRAMGQDVTIVQAVNQKGKIQKVEIHSHGSGTGFTAIAEGRADMAMSSRPIKQEEHDMVAHFGDMSSYKAEYVIGLDGIAIIVNQKNTIRSLQKNVLAKIFSGEINDWNQLDSSMRGTIKIYARDDKSGTYDTFKSLVLGKQNLITTAKRYESSTQLSDDVSQDPLAIGFIGLPYVRQARAMAISEAGSMARLPDVFDVATEDYALSRRLFLYLPVAIENNNAIDFIRFVMASEGQQLVQDNGFVSQEIMAQAVNLDKNLPNEYLDFTQSGQRLSLNIRFHKGSVAVDTKAHQDLGRLVKYMSLPDNANKKIMLFGFSDETRSLPEYGEDLATHRVDRVADLLVRKGIDPIRVRAYGSANPVASNDDIASRFKNRRVEIWVQ